MRGFTWKPEPLLVKFVLIALALSVAPIAVAGYLTYRQAEESLRAEYSIRLGSLAIQRQQTLNLIVTQQEKVLEVLAHDSSLLSLAKTLKSVPPSVATSTLRTIQKHTPFVGLLLTDSSKRRLITSGAFERATSNWTADVENAFKGEFLRFEVGEDGKPVFIMGTPLEAPSTVSASPGVLLAWGDLWLIHGLFDSRAALGRTGESFITDRHGRPLTSVRYHHQGSLEPGTYEIKAEPMKACLRGENSSFTIEPDYLNVLTVMSYRSLPEIGGGCLMVHVRAEEAFSAARALQAKLFTLIGFVIVAVLPISLFVGMKVFRLAEQNRMRREIALRREAEKLRNVQVAMSQILVESDTIDGAVPRLLRVIGEELGWDGGEFWVLDHKDMTLSCRALWQTPIVQPEQAVALDRKLPFSQASFPKNTLANGAPFWVSDLQQAPDSWSWALQARDGMRSIVCLPIVSGEDVLGFMQFFSLSRRESDAAALHLLGDLGVKLGQFIARKRAEEELRESESSLRLVLDTALDAVVAMDEDGTITHWNHAAETIFGWTREEAIGRKLSDTILPVEGARDDTARYLLSIGKFPVPNKRIETVAVRRDGSAISVELSVSPIKAGGSYLLSAFIADITERKRRERRLVIEQAVTRILVESLTLAEGIPPILEAICKGLGWEVGLFWTVDERFNVLRCNQSWPSQSIELEHFVAVSKQTTFPAGVGLPGRVLASGEPAWIPDVQQDANFPRARIAAHAGLHGAFGFPICRTNQVLGLMEFFSSKIEKPDEELLQMLGAIGSLIGLIMDSKRTEGRLTSSVALDFNNLLTVIRGYSDHLLSRLREDNPLRVEIQQIKTAGERAAPLIIPLVAFAQDQGASSKNLDLRQVVTNMEDVIRAEIGDEAELLIAFQPGLGQIKSDLAQIETLILNLVANMRDAISPGSAVTIDCSNVELDELYAQMHPGSRAGSYVMFVLSCTRGGMEAVTMPDIFESFFTAQSEGHESLANVYAIVKDHKGFISYSKDDDCLMVRVYLPRVKSASPVEKSF